MQTPFHAFIKARELENSGDLLAVYASSSIEVYPYQIAAAQFALRSPYLRGVILCDEGSLGKSYEAMLIAVKKWYAGAKVAIIVTIPLYEQWRAAMIELARGITKDTKAVELVKTRAKRTSRSNGGRMCGIDCCPTKAYQPNTTARND